MAEGEAVLPDLPHPDVVIVGAGIAGLTAAGELVGRGRRVLILEKSRGVGGRMATRRLGDAVCDHGAQFFTVRDAGFGGIVASAAAAGAVTPWCEGFAHGASIAGPARSAGDGHVRWRGVRGMTDLPKFLATSLPPRQCRLLTSARVGAVSMADDRVRLSVETADGSRPPLTIDTGGLLLTAPVPQSLELLAAGGVVASSPMVDPDAYRQLARVAYDPCFALMLVLDGPSDVPPPGGIQFAEGPVTWLADNGRKGITTVPAVTVHASGAYTRERFEDAPDAVAEDLIALVRPWLGGMPGRAVTSRSLHRWKFATPTTVLPDPFVRVTAYGPPLVCCGDAFAGPRVEGAAASGLAAGRWLADNCRRAAVDA